MASSDEDEAQGHRHSDFKCTLVAELRADLPSVLINTTTMAEEPYPRGRTEHHGLLYSDGSVALTYYENCYAIFHIRSGELLSGTLWNRGEWILDEPSRALAMSHASPDRRAWHAEMDEAPDVTVAVAVELESPPFTPAALERFEERGYERQHRRTKG